VFFLCWLTLCPWGTYSLRTTQLKNRIDIAFVLDGWVRVFFSLTLHCSFCLSIILQTQFLFQFKWRNSLFHYLLASNRSAETEGEAPSALVLASAVHFCIRFPFAKTWSQNFMIEYLLILDLFISMWQWCDDFLVNVARPIQHFQQNIRQPAHLSWHYSQTASIS
jgi:hypothetical protein